MLLLHRTDRRSEFQTQSSGGKARLTPRLVGQTSISTSCNVQKLLETQQKRKYLTFSLMSAQNKDSHMSATKTDAQTYCLIHAMSSLSAENVNSFIPTALSDNSAQRRRRRRWR